MLSLVIPVYNNAANLPPLFAALEKLNQSLAHDMEVVFVVDGSPDDSLQILGRSLGQVGFRSQLLSLSRNFGAFSAIKAGLEAGKGELFAVMAADLQEPPALIADFYRELSTGDYDIAIGTREKRTDPSLGKGASVLFWAVYRRLVQPEIPAGGVDVFGCTRTVRDHLLRMPENNTSLVGQLFWVGFRRVFVPYERHAREIGKSSWTLSKKLRYLSDSVFAFSDLPVRLLFNVGVLGLGLSVLFSLVVLTWKLIGAIPVPGYAATVLTVTFFGALNCMGLGIVGGYVWRTYENTKVRPNFIVARREEFRGASKDLSASSPVAKPLSTVSE